MRRFFIAALLAISCRAQNAVLTGTVTAGSQAAPVADAIATLRLGAKTLSTHTAADGMYRFVNLEAGNEYRLSITAAGFQAFEQAGLSLAAEQDRRIDAQLTLANRNESVTVTAYDADGQGNSAEVSQLVDSQQLHDLPGVNRTPAKFALLDPHVRQAIGLGADYQDANRLSIDAGSYRNTSYVLDGTTMYDWIYAVTPQELVPLGAVQELKIFTGDYPAQYGISTTGVLVTTTRSGTNQFHGEAFGYLRPSGIQASPPLSPFRVPNERHEWGFLGGGPLQKDRFWFFADFERAYQQRGSLIQSPSISFFNGVSSDYSGLLKLDYKLDQQNALTWRFNGNHFAGNDINDRIAGFTQPSAGREAKTQAWGTQLSERFSHNNLLNAFRWSFVDYVPDSAFPLNSSVSVVRPNYSTTGYSTVNWVHATSYDVNDTVALTYGPHQIKFGGEFVRLTARDYAYTPLGTYTFAPGPPNTGQLPISYSQTFGTQDVHYGQTELNAFFSDEIRLSPRLTATLGLRYEYQSITLSQANFGPRLALAWDVAGNGKTVIRVGSGIFYDQQFLYVTRRFYIGGPNAPTQAFSIPYGTPGFPTFPNSLAVPPAGASAGKLNLYLPGQILNPYSLQFSASVEQHVGYGFILSIGGQHTHTLRQPRVNDINHPAPFVRTASNQVRSGSSADATRPFALYMGVPVRDVAVIENSASSLYDALDIGLTKRLGKRLQLAAHYVLASSASYSMFYADANSGIPNDWDNWGSAERAPSDFFQGQRFSGNAFIHLPLKFDLGLVAIAASGLPVNPTTGIDNNGDTYTVDRPRGFGRNSFRGPGQVNLDTSISRPIRLLETLQAELRFEATNILNRNNYITVNNIYGQTSQPLATFLTPMAGVANTDPSRQLRFAIRLRF